MPTWTSAVRARRKRHSQGGDAEEGILAEAVVSTKGVNKLRLPVQAVRLDPRHAVRNDEPAPRNRKGTYAFLSGA